MSQQPKYICPRCGAVTTVTVGQYLPQGGDRPFGGTDTKPKETPKMECCGFQPIFLPKPIEQENGKTD